MDEPQSSRSLQTQESGSHLQNPLMLRRHKLSFFEEINRTSPLQSIQEIYKSTKQFITEVDHRISKSNIKSQMKASEKLLLINKSLETEVLRLRKRLKHEEMNTNPTKEYINDILNQLVAFKRENQSLKKQLSQSKYSVTLLKSVVQTRRQRYRSLNQNSRRKKHDDKLPLINISTISDTKKSIQHYLEQKSLRQGKKQQSKFSIFLKGRANQSLELNQLLHQIDVWISKDFYKNPHQTLVLRNHVHQKPFIRISQNKQSFFDYRNNSEFDSFTMPDQDFSHPPKISTKKIGQKQ